MKMTLALVSCSIVLTAISASAEGLPYSCASGKSQDGTLLVSEPDFVGTIRYARGVPTGATGIYAFFGSTGGYPTPNRKITQKELNFQREMQELSVSMHALPPSARVERAEIQMEIRELSRSHMMESSGSNGLYPGGGGMMGMNPIVSNGTDLNYATPPDPKPGDLAAAKPGDLAGMQPKAGAALRPGDAVMIQGSLSIEARMDASGKLAELNYQKSDKKSGPIHLDARAQPARDPVFARVESSVSKWKTYVSCCMTPESTSCPDGTSARAVNESEIKSLEQDQPSDVRPNESGMPMSLPFGGNSGRAK